MTKRRVARILTILLLVPHLVAAPVITLAQQGDERLLLRRPWGQTTEQIPSSFRRDSEGQTNESSSRPLGTPQPVDLGRVGGEGAMGAVSYQVHLVGEVRQPGTYHVLASQRLQEALQRAGGVSPQGSVRSVQIRRQGSDTRTYDLLRFQLFGELQHNPYLLDNDVIYVPLRTAPIQVVGSVKRPNNYELKNEHTLADAIALAGGLTAGAAANAPVRLIRFENGEKQVLEIHNDPHALRATPIRRGDVIYVSNVLAANRKFDYNIAKIPGDQVFYPSYEDRVFVLGGVYNPGPYPFNPYATVNQYLTTAGGTTKLGKINRIRLIASDGRKRRIRMDDVDVINPGDTIYVPEPRIAPEGWIGIVTGLATFGLSTTVTVLSLTR